MQCFNCQEYGHMIRACRKATKCGECAEEHSTRDHKSSKDSVKRCAVCGKTGHRSWEIVCQTRIQETNRMRQKLTNKTREYSLQRTSESDRSDKTDSNEWSTVPSSKKRKASESTIGSQKRSEPLGSMTTVSMIMKKLERPLKLQSKEIEQQSLQVMINTESQAETSSASCDQEMQEKNQAQL